MYASLRLYVGIPIPRDLIVTKTGTVQNMCSKGHVSVLGAAYCSDCGGKATLTDEEEFTPAFKKLCEANGSPDPRTGYDSLREMGWMIAIEGEGDAITDEPTFKVELGSISVETSPEVGRAEIVGLKIMVAHLAHIGDESYTSSVLELPLQGFQPQAHVLKTLAGMLECEGTPCLYPQVSLG